MRGLVRLTVAGMAVCVSTASAQRAGQAAAASARPPLTTPADSVVRAIVGRLDLERYKATVKGLTMFGDRRQGTDRNRAAVDWIETQLKSYGCTNTERIRYMYNQRQLRNDSTNRADSIAGRAGGRGGAAAPAAGAAGRGGAGAAGRGGAAPAPAANAAGRGGGNNANQPPVKGYTARTGVNTNPALQPDPRVRELDAQFDTPGPREEVFCTKIGTTRPDEMFIVGAHMDGHGYGTAANDDGSGSALVMELARIISSPDIQTERSIRFILFNNEETGGGAAAYVQQRAPLQGVENPPGSGKYPEPRWIAMIQHDMMMFDHGMPGPDGKVSPEQRREADVNIEFAGTSTYGDSASKIAFYFRRMNDRFATDYPAAVGDRMSNTDSQSFQNAVASISLRENERLAHIGTGWDPQWHQPTDVFETYSDKDFRLGLNAAQTTLSAMITLTGASIK